MPAKTKIDAPKLREALARWFREQARDLPWRNEPTLYKTVVSELMLQQTQVKTVLPYFARWQKRFPDFPTLAQADEADVLKHWEGLGYYSRARNLHKLAKAISAMPEPPTTAKEWQKLPGIGPYTAASITSLRFGQKEAVVDGNVIRVLTRLTADSTPFKDNASAIKAIRPLAQELLNPDEPGLHNEAMMELGATVCTRAKPQCLLCPLRPHCKAGQQGDPESYPVLIRKQAMERTVERIWLLHDGKLLLEKGAANSKRLAGIYELPLANGKLKPAKSAKPKATFKRGIANERITENIFELKANKTILQAIESNDSLHWVSVAAIDKVTLSGPHKKWIKRIQKTIL